METTFCSSIHPLMHCSSGSSMAGPSQCRVKVDHFMSPRAKMSKTQVERFTVLVLILSQARGLPTTPGSFSHQVTPSPTSLALQENGANCCFRSRRPKKWASFNTAPIGVRWRYWRSVKSKLMMANPEGTQQLRDRDLEFMFYDEAQVPR